MPTLDAAARARVAAHASPAGWQRLVARLPRLAAIQARPEALADCLSDCWPGSQAAALVLLRAVQARHWSIGPDEGGATAAGQPGFIVRVDRSRWRVRLQAGRELAASSVERLPSTDERVPS